MRGWVPPPPRHPRLRKHWCCWLLGRGSCARRAPRGARVLEAATTVRQSGVPAPSAAARARVGRDSAWHARLLDHEWTPSEGTATACADRAVPARTLGARARRAPRGATVLEAATTVRQSGVPAPSAAARANLIVDAGDAAAAFSVTRVWRSGILYPRVLIRSASICTKSRVPRATRHHRRVP